MPELKASEALAQTNGNGNGHHEPEEVNLGGRKTKLTKNLSNRICRALRNKNPISNACKLVGISYTTFKEWRKEALLGTDPKKVAFLADVERAIADAQASMIKCVSNKAANDWKAAAFILERRHPEEWGRKDFVKSEISGPSGGPIQQKTETVERPIEGDALKNFVRDVVHEMDAAESGNGR